MKRPGNSPGQREQQLPRPQDVEEGSVWLEPGQQEQRGAGRWGRVEI